MSGKASAINTFSAISGSTSRDGMKKAKVVYWSTTGIIAAVMLSSGLYFAFSPEMKQGFIHLGLPNWFRVELTIAKLLGAIALVVPAIPARIKEFAYFGFGIVLVSASVAHLSSGDGFLFEIGHWMFFITLVVSYLYFHKLTDGRAPIVRLEA